MHTLLDLAFTDPVRYVSIVFVVVASIVLHELGHALAASWEGDPTARIRGHVTWNPVVHMGWISLVLVALMGIGWGMTPVNPAMFRHRRWGDALVSFAGPAVNLFLACVAACVLVRWVNSGRDPEGAISVFWTVALRMNVLLFCFNLIPLPPLDGFTVADGAFDLGNLGALLRSAGMLPMIAAILVLNTDAFGVVLDVATGAVLEAAKAVVLL